jgi:hypothetical protein
MAELFQAALWYQRTQRPANFEQSSALGAYVDFNVGYCLFGKRRRLRSPAGQNCFSSLREGSILAERTPEKCRLLFCICSRY